MAEQAIKPVILTTGEPAGIGPDLAVMLAQQAQDDRPLVVAGNADVLEARARRLGLPLRLRPYSKEHIAPTAAGEMLLRDIPVAASVTPGVLNPANAQHVLALLDDAIDGCQSGEYAAMVTGPLHKGVINDAGMAFTGHTEYLAEKTEAWPVMMLATPGLRVALVTTHLPLSAVPAAITPQRLRTVCTILHESLVTWFGIANPRVLVCGLNPHAGENGHMGREEIDVITPVLDELREAGMQWVGPLPADTLYTEHHLKNADATLAMFHDQGLPVLKHAGFGKAVNITLGLPIIRTSVDHGTALDLAGSGRINSGSLAYALDVAHELAANRQRT